MQLMKVDPAAFGQTPKPIGMLYINLYQLCKLSSTASTTSNTLPN
jgi:hypothetical protein